MESKFKQLCAPAAHELAENDSYRGSYRKSAAWLGFANFLVLHFVCSDAIGDCR